MKTATIPSVHVEPGFRAEVEPVLAEGESLSDFVETWVAASVERGSSRAEFISRGLRSRLDAQRTSDYVEADVVVAGLQRKPDAARSSGISACAGIRNSGFFKSTSTSTGLRSTQA